VESDFGLAHWDRLLFVPVIEDIVTGTRYGLRRKVRIGAQNQLWAPSIASGQGLILKPGGCRRCVIPLRRYNPRRARCSKMHVPPRSDRNPRLFQNVDARLSLIARPGCRGRFPVSRRKAGGRPRRAPKSAPQRPPTGDGSNCGARTPCVSTETARPSPRSCASHTG